MESVPVADELRQTAFVVMPAHNEAACVESVLRELVAVYPNVVVVDDGSSDDTAALARRLAPYVLTHSINRGQGAALQTGIEFALRRGARYVVTFDADGQHCAGDIAALLEPIHAGECEITLGSRFLGTTIAMPPTRRLLLRLAVLFTRIVNRMPLTDAHNGMRAFSRQAAECIQISMDRMAHASEIIDLVRRSGLPYREVGVQIRYTKYSLAKGQSLRDALHVISHYLIGRAVR